MDVTNLDSLVPMQNGNVHMKVLKMPQGVHSKVFAPGMFTTENKKQDRQPDRKKEVRQPEKKKEEKQPEKKKEEKQPEKKKE